MITLSRFLFLCSLISIYFPGIAAPLAHAKLGPISIRSVYTTSENDKPKIVFSPDAKIQYHVDVDNTTGGTFPIDIRFQAFANDYSPDTNLYHYDQTYHVDQMPVGLSRFYTPVTLPSNAKSYFYAARITVTPSGCQGTACGNDGDWGESTFTIQLCTQPPQNSPPSTPSSCQPEGKADNLIVLVHGCCTDAKGVNVLREVGTHINEKLVDKTKWEVVVWDWHEYTPPLLPGKLNPETIWWRGNDVAYQNAKPQGPLLANAIALHHYKHVHLIGHSAGAKLIHEAASAYIGNYLIRKDNPVIHLTFLDAYTPSDSDTSSYGSLPTDYPNHYSEHYVDRGLPFTDACLKHAFNFDITHWTGTPPKDDRISEFGIPEFGHQWPHRWYGNSVITQGYDVGFPLSLESGHNLFTTAANDFPPGYQCSLSNVNTCMPRAPAPCW